jgi:dTDP-4-dehydrorhamnose 3,5-epimerase
MASYRKILDDVILINNQLHGDNRGEFFESFNQDYFRDSILPEFSIAQLNNSKSSAGTLRGIHFSKAPQGQSKLITCTHGSAIDIAIDLRENSATFLEFTTVTISAFDGKSVFIPHGFGHGFLALEDDTVISYALSSRYSPDHEFTISPLDPLFKDSWVGTSFILSNRDRDAPTIKQALELGIIGI